jgi:hypothetical protein
VLRSRRSRKAAGASSAARLTSSTPGRVSAGQRCG